MSPIIINESSNPDSDFGSDKDEDPVTFKAFQRSLKSMVQSKNKTDKRYINLHRVG